MSTMETLSKLAPTQFLVPGPSSTSGRIPVYYEEELKELPVNVSQQIRAKIPAYPDGSNKNQLPPEEEQIDGLIWNEEDSSVTLVNQNLWQIPSTLTNNYASRVRRLDLSYNCLQTLSGIEYFNCLEELVLDNNQLDDSIRFFYNPFMRILSVNKNKLTDLERFLNEVTLKLPGLTYLSLLGNSACPDQLSSSEHDEKDYSRYRSYVIHRMPQLRFLDSTPIRPNERSEAQKRGHYYRLIRLNSDSEIEKNRIKNHLFDLRQETPERQPITSLPYTDKNLAPKGGFGRLKHRYNGKHSEGNRFIRNHEL